MESNDSDATSFGTKPLTAQRGAGGKFRKPSSRRPPFAPYARPLQNQTDSNSSRWFSKLVDPACRLISGGATLFFPSFFPKSASATNTLEQHEEKEEEVEEEEEADQGNSVADVAPTSMDVDSDADLTLNKEASRSTAAAGISRVDGQFKSCCASDGRQQCQEVDVSDHNQLSEIERLVKGKNFSRDELNRLMVIIRSREMNHPEVEQQEKHSGVSVGEVRGSAAAFEHSGKPTEEKQQNLGGCVRGTPNNLEKVIPGEVKGPDVSLQNMRSCTEERHGDFNSWGTQTPLFLSTVRDDVGTSPVEIARAYMENRTLELGFDSKNLISKDEGTRPLSSTVASKPIPSPLPKTSTCWPGALVQDHHLYMTPQSQRGRFIRNLTPNSTYSESRSKFPFRGDRHVSVTMKRSSIQQSETPPYGQVSSRGTSLGDGNGSGGPIRRARQKFIVGNLSGRSPYSRSPLTTTSLVENINISENSSTLKKNLEKGETSHSSKFLILDSKPQSSEVAGLTVPAHSRQMARKILEHLERNPPTPKDKSAELRRATSWRQQQSSDATSVVPDKHASITHFGVLGSKQTDQVDRKNLPQWMEESGKSIFNPPSQMIVSKANGSGENEASPSEIKVGNGIPRHGNDGSFRKSRDFQPIGEHEDFSKLVPTAAGSELLSLQKKPPSHPSSNKPVLPSISIGKPNAGWTLSYDKSSGFSFPVSSSSGVSSEPPTPSIMPSSHASSLHLNNIDIIPSYSFGSKSSNSLIFSFPSIAGAAMPDDASTPQFEFGSDKTSRISFASVGKNAICY